MIKEKIATLKQNGFDIRYLIMGGSPTFPCYAPYEDVYCSPGTIFIIRIWTSRLPPRFSHA